MMPYALTAREPVGKSTYCPRYFFHLFWTNVGPIETDRHGSQCATSVLKNRGSHGVHVLSRFAIIHRIAGTTDILELNEQRIDAGYAESRQDRNIPVLVERSYVFV